VPVRGEAEDEEEADEAEEDDDEDEDVVSTGEMAGVTPGI